jgi:hypothetical protein
MIPTPTPTPTPTSFHRLGRWHRRRGEGHPLGELVTQAGGEGAEDGLCLGVARVTVAQAVEDGARGISQDGVDCGYGGRVEGLPFGGDCCAGDLPGAGC